MGSKKVSPNRRKSIAVTSHVKNAPLPRSKRRPHSIVAGDRLSPLMKARRSLVRRMIFELGQFVKVVAGPTEEHSKGSIYFSG